ncbi:hypothetical protein [Nesterenkonia pannonica]|nr:hypothetical protein [Nesterenkonia pannonica]
MADISLFRPGPMKADMVTPSWSASTASAGSTISTRASHPSCRTPTG